MHPLAAASRSRLLETEPKYLCSKLHTMRSVDDIVLNMSLRKLSKHEHSIERYCIELLDSKQKTWIKAIFFDGIVRIELACCFFRCTCSLYPFIAIHYSIELCLRCLLAGKEISCPTAVLARSSPNGGDTSRIHSNEPNFLNNVLLVAKEFFHFKLSNVAKRANLYGIVISTCIVFLAMYTFVVVTMRLCGQRNTSPK